MRITTQMLNNTAMKTGLNLYNNSLLYNLNSSSKNSFLSVLNSRYSNTSSVLQKNNYKKLDEAADDLKQEAEMFIESKDGNIYDKARKSGSNKEICSSVEEMAESYNDTLKALSSTSNTLNSYYSKMLRAAAKDNSDELAEIGITVEKNGTVSVNKNKLMAADVDTIEEVLGNNGTFSQRTAFIADRVSDNAEANIKSLSNTYNSTGSIYSLLAGRYNFWC